MRIIISLLTFLFFAKPSLVYSYENSLDWIEFQDLIELKKDAIESGRLLPLGIRDLIFNPKYSGDLGKVKIIGSNSSSNIQFYFEGKLNHIQDTNLNDDPPAYLVILYCKRTECINQVGYKHKKSDYFNFDKKELYYAQHYYVTDWSVQNNNYFTIKINEFSKSGCVIIVKSYEDDCNKNLIKDNGKKNYIELIFDFHDFSFKMWKKDSKITKKESIENNQTKSITNKKLQYWNLRNPKFNNDTLSLDTIYKIRNYKVKTQKKYPKKVKKIENKDTNDDENNFNSKSLLKKLLGIN